MHTRSHPLRHALARLAHLPTTRDAPLHGGPADGLVLIVPRPAPPWVFASLRPMVDGAVLLATVCDETAVYVSALGEAEGIARYRRDGARYLHVSDGTEQAVPSRSPA